MAFKTVGGQRVYHKYSEKNPGDILINNGKYLGTEEGKYGIVHLFDVDGVTECLNSAGLLNYTLERHVVPGMRVNITYGGKEVLTKGAMAGKESHQFTVEVDDTPQEVKAQPVAAAPVATKAATATTVMKKTPTKAKTVNAVNLGEDIEL